MATKVTSHVIADNAVTDAKLHSDFTATTQSASDNSTNVATTAYVTTAIANLSDSAPSTLNTLNELAAALGDDANYATTTTNAIAAKAPLASPTLTGTPKINVGTNKNIIFSGGIGEIGSVPGFQGINDAGSANTDIGMRGNSIRFATGSDERMRIDANGNVGIGETNPDASLHIKSNTPIISFDESDASQEYRIGSFGGAFAVYDSTDSAYRIIVDGSGNVGINETSPTSYANSQATLVIKDSTGPAISWNDTGQTRNWYAIAQGSGLHFNYADGGGSGGASNVTSALILDNSGKVGIGTDNPSSNLHVETSGNANIRIQAGTNSSASLRLRNDAIDWDVNCQTNDNFAIYNQTSSAERLVIKAANGGIQQQSYASSSNRKEEVFHTKTVGTSWTNFFSVDIASAHRAVFFEIITFGADWSGHSAARSYYKGFVSGTTSYSGDGEIENSGTYGSGSHIDWNYTRSGSTVTFQSKLYSGSVGLEAYIRVIGTFGNITLL